MMVGMEMPRCEVSAGRYAVHQGAATMKKLFVAHRVARPPLLGSGSSRQVRCHAAGASTASQLVAKAVGWAVIGGSCFRSFPQILRIYKSKSVQGLSTTAFVNETVVCIINMAYNLRHGYPFSSYGDALTCGLQNAVILAQMFRHGSISRLKQVLITIGLSGFTAALCLGIASDALLAHLQVSSVLLLALGGRLPQIWMNIVNGGSGELSMGSAALSVAGNLGRLYTTLTLVDDKRVLVASVSQLALNAILLWQTAATAWKKRSGAGPAYKAA